MGRSRFFGPFARRPSWPRRRTCEARGGRPRVGIKDGLFFGAVLTRDPGQRPTVDSNPSDARATLAGLFDMTAPTPALAATTTEEHEVAGVFVLAGSCDLISEFSTCAEYDLPWLSAIDEAADYPDAQQEECVEDLGGTWSTDPCPTEGAREERCQVTFEGGRTSVRYYAASGPTWESPADDCAYRAQAGFGQSELVQR